jgi:dTDP-4-dehydrorhamnose reductase
MRIGITGAGRQQGRSLQDVLDGHEVVPVDLPGYDITRLDVVTAIEGFQPDVVIHAGAMTDVDACELDADAAYSVNALGTRNVAGAGPCRRRQEPGYDAQWQRPIAST